MTVPISYHDYLSHTMTVPILYHDCTYLIPWLYLSHTMTVPISYHDFSTNICLCCLLHPKFICVFYLQTFGDNLIIISTLVLYSLYSNIYVTIIFSISNPCKERITNCCRNYLHLGRMQTASRHSQLPYIRYAGFMHFVNSLLERCLHPGDALAPKK